VTAELICLGQTVLRTARKAHRCRGCGHYILSGERYAEYLGESASYQSGHRYHLGNCTDTQLGAGMTRALEGVTPKA
jgi:hypothetical protein